VTAAWTAGACGLGPGDWGLVVDFVYVRWDGDGLVCGISMRDLKLEPAEAERPPLTPGSLKSETAPSQSLSSETSRHPSA
jgi:hypothetical protein